MIQIPLAVAVTLIIVLHTILTHLINWGLRETLDHETGRLLILFSFAEVALTIALLCNMKLV